MTERAAATDSPVALSLIVPVYNESARIVKSLLTMSRYLEGQRYRSEIIVVDDGSSDDTAAIVQREASRLPTAIRLIRYARNGGKGYALKVGFAVSRGERLLFTDVDLSTPIEESQRLLAELDAGFDIAIGSRRLAGAHIEIRQSRIRETLGKVFTAIVRASIARVSDATCGFKAFRGDVGRQIFSRSRIYDWSFDAEILRIAIMRGHSIKEVPVHWEDREGSKVKILRDGVAALVGILRIRLNSALGRYSEAVSIGSVHEIRCGDGADFDPATSDPH